MEETKERYLVKNGMVYFLKNNWKIYIQKYTLLKYNEIKFTRFDKKLILDFTDPKK